MLFAFILPDEEKHMNNPVSEEHCPIFSLQLISDCCLPSLSAKSPSKNTSAPKASYGRKQLPIEGWSIQIAHTFREVAHIWRPPANIFLQGAFLEALEQFPPRGMAFAYVVFFYEHKPAGIAYGQLADLKIQESLAASLSATPGLSGRLKQQLAGLARYQLLVCGNMLLTGSNGFHFASKDLSETLVAKLLEAAFLEVADSFRRRGRKVNLIMVKDINPCCPGVSKALSGLKFHDFTFQPDMNLAINPEWKTTEDYLNAMSSKYRVRARRASKKGLGITRRELHPATAKLEAPVLYTLYKEVASRADFNPYELHPEYFVALKQALPEQFRIFGYYLQDKLVGFFTMIRQQDKMESHLLGFKNDINASHQLYLNMLYDMVGVAIEEGVRTLGFARTAMEIKSSVGATPQHFDCRLRHELPIANTLMPFFIRWFEPNDAWTQRHPFRGEG